MNAPRKIVAVREWIYCDDGTVFAVRPREPSPEARAREVAAVESGLPAPRPDAFEWYNPGIPPLPGSEADPLHLTAVSHHTTQSQFAEQVAERLNEIRAEGAQIGGELDAMVALGQVDPRSLVRTVERVDKIRSLAGAPFFLVTKNWPRG